MDIDGRELFHLYLRDHVAGAAAGVALAKRLASSEQDRAVREPIELLLADLERDAGRLREIMTALGGSPRAPVKERVARLGVRLGAMKLNGRLVRRSPLSRVYELEGLLAGVMAKRALWKTLQKMESVDSRLTPFDPQALIERAEAQAALLMDLHDRAVPLAFAGEQRRAA